MANIALVQKYTGIIIIITKFNNNNKLNLGMDLRVRWRNFFLYARTLIYYDNPLTSFALEVCPKLVRGFTSVFCW